MFQTAYDKDQTIGHRAYWRAMLSESRAELIDGVDASHLSDAEKIETMSTEQLDALTRPNKETV